MECKRCGSCCYFKRECVDGEEIKSDPCPYLVIENNTTFCSIYNMRPIACRNYNCEEDPFREGKWNSKGVKQELGL